MNNSCTTLYTSLRRSFAAKIYVFGNKFIEKRLLYRINIIYRRIDGQTDIQYNVIVDCRKSVMDYGFLKRSIKCPMSQKTTRENMFLKFGFVDFTYVANFENEMLN